MKTQIIKRQSLTKNFVFQFLYQGLILVIPMIISPYLTRVVGKNGLGIYAYSNSIAYYFVVFAMLGISRHGQRIISENRDCIEMLRKKFWSLIGVHIFFSSIAIAMYSIFVEFFIHDHKIIYWIQVLYVASALFDITWFFQGLEHFQSVIIKNAIIKVLECISIFCFVKSANDLWIYALISSGGILIGQIIMIPQAIKMVKPIKISRIDVLEHIKPLFVLAVAVVASALYTIFDKTLLGILSNSDNVALYEYSNKIIQIPRTFITVIGAVIYPRACSMASKEDYNGQRKYIKLSLMITFLLGSASVFGLLSVAKPLAVLYYGESFRECGTIIMSMTPLIIFVGLGDVLRTQFLIPMHMDGKFVKVLCANAIINLIFSAFLIPIIGVYGAIVGTGLAELFGLCIQLFLCRKIVSLLDIMKISWPYLVSGVIMLLVIEMFNMLYDSKMTDITRLIFDVFVGGISFLGSVIIFYFIFDRKTLCAIIDYTKKHKVGIK